MFHVLISGNMSRRQYGNSTAYHATTLHILHMRSTTVDDHAADSSTCDVTVAALFALLLNTIYCVLVLGSISPGHYTVS